MATIALTDYTDRLEALMDDSLLSELSSRQLGSWTGHPKLSDQVLKEFLSGINLTITETYKLRNCIDKHISFLIGDNEMLEQQVQTSI